MKSYKNLHLKRRNFRNGMIYMKNKRMSTFKDMPIWQRRFIILAVINLSVIVTLISLLLINPPVSDKLPKPTYPESTGAAFTVEATKSDLNHLINTYINDVLKTNQGNFEVGVNEDIQLTGNLFAFGVPIPLNVRMDPVVMENGDLVLEMNEISLGLLKLPRDRILHYINRQVQTPDWLYFDSENEQIYLAVTSIEVDSNLRFQVNALDLSTDSIIFTFTIPESRKDIDALK